MGGLQDGEEEFEDLGFTRDQNVSFTEEELGFAIGTLKQDKAPGLDLVDVRMVRCINRKVKVSC